MKSIVFFGLLLLGVALTFFSDNLVYGQSSSQNSIKVIFEDAVLPTYEIPLIPGQTFTVTQNHSWVHDETSRYNLVSYTLDGESVKISRTARGDFTLSLPTDSSHVIVFTAVPQYALSVEGTTAFSYLPSSPTNDNWFDVGTEVSINVQKTTEIEPNKVRQEITGWSLDKSEFWNIDDDGSTSFTTPPILMNEYHQVDFFTSYQYKLNVVSDVGKTSGSGWYEQGVRVPIGIDPGNDGLVFNSLSGWVGYDVEYDGNIAHVFIDGPVTVSATIEKNYSILAAMIIIPILILGYVLRKKLKSSPNQTENKPVEKVIEKVIEKVVESPTKKYEDGYDQKLSNYLSEQTNSSLSDMLSSKIISKSKYSKIKEMSE